MDVHCNHTCRLCLELLTEDTERIVCSKPGEILQTEFQDPLYYIPDPYKLCKTCADDLPSTDRLVKKRRLGLRRYNEGYRCNYCNFTNLNEQLQCSESSEMNPVRNLGPANIENPSENPVPTSSQNVNNIVEEINGHNLQNAMTQESHFNPESSQSMINNSVAQCSNSEKNVFIDLTSDDSNDSNQEFKPELGEQSPQSETNRPPVQTSNPSKTVFIDLTNTDDTSDASEISSFTSSTSEH